MNEQGSDAWKLERAGKWTGSKFADVLARNKTTGKPLKAYYDLIWQVVTERLTGEPIEGPQGYALAWGSDVEPYARQAYELRTGAFVEQCEFIVHPKYIFAGASLDGSIGDDGAIEMKCPKDPRVHLERFVDGVPDEYIPQMQGGMWVTDRQWCDFVSYDPRMPETHRLLIIRVQRDDVYIKRLESAVIEAEAAARALLDKLLLRAA